MKIERPSSPSPTTRPVGTQRAASASAFADLVRTSAPTGAPPPTRAATVAATTALIALQEVEELDERRRRAVGRAHAMLDELEEIRNALLLGGLPAETLARIRRLLAERPAELGDPKLESLVREVELRTEVELAKLERSSPTGR